MDDHDLSDRLRHAAENATALATAPGAELAVRRGRHRDRRRAVAAFVVVAGLLGAAAVIPRLPTQRPAAPAGAAATVVRVPTQGFELPLPSGWRVQRELTGTRPATSSGASRSSVMGVVLTPRSGRPAGAAITITTNSYDPMGKPPVGRRPDGRDYTLVPGSGSGEVGRYVLPWAEYPCDETETCKPPRRHHIRGLLVSGVAAPGDRAGREQVLQAMKQVAISVRPITNALVPPPPPTVPADTKVLIGTGGSGDMVWQAWIEPLEGNAGFSMHFPQARPSPAKHWEKLEPEYIRRHGTQTQMDCFDWMPGSGLLLSGLAKTEAAKVRFELQGQPPVTVATFGRDKQLPWVAYASPVLPAGSRVERVVGLDSAGRAIGAETDLFEGMQLCVPRP